MESLSNRRTSARRAADAGPRLNPLRMLVASDESASETTVLSGWVRHGVAAGIVALLGLVVASSFWLTTSTDHTDSSANPRMTADAPDITQAAPAGSQSIADTSRGSAQDRTPDTASGNLDTYDRRERSTSRQAVRDELAKVAAEQQAKARAKGLTKSNDSARDDAATRAETKRTDDVAKAAEAARVEQARLVEEKRKAEEAARLAKIAAEKAEKAERARVERAARGVTGGIGASGGTSARLAEPQIDTGDIPNGEAVSPLAFGSYQLSARWGAYGSWSRWHTGLDMSASIGTPIRAAATGVVISSDGASGWAGVHVSIRHADGSATLYAHMSGKTVSPGTMVTAGTVIGYIGMTGRTFGPHLHFEYYPPGTTPGDVYSARDPWAWLYSKNVRL